VDLYISNQKVSHKVALHLKNTAHTYTHTHIHRERERERRGGGGRGEGKEEGEGEERGRGRRGGERVKGRQVEREPFAFHQQQRQGGE
jgi:hypothetical protein